MYNGCGILVQVAWWFKDYICLIPKMYKKWV